MSMRGILAGLVMICMLGESASIWADSDTLTINISGTISESSCTVNANETVSAEFGSVQTDEISSATASVPVTISCEGTPSGTVSMEIKGTTSTFNGQALATDTPGLGITLGSTGTTQYGILDLNKFYDVTSAFGLTNKTGSFTLTAYLTSDGTTKLTGGEFNAIATLVLQMN